MFLSLYHEPDKEYKQFMLSTGQPNDKEVFDKMEAEEEEVEDSEEEDADQ